MCSFGYSPTVAPIPKMGLKHLFIYTTVRGLLGRPAIVGRGFVCGVARPTLIT